MFRLNLSLAAVLAATSAIAAPPQPLKVLIVTGGCCHDYPVQRELLKKGLEQRAYVDVETVYQGGTATDSKIPLYENANWSEGFDVVIHDECFSGVNDKDWIETILKPHREGLPGVVLHCAMHCYRDGTTSWFDFCGVTSHRHGAHYPHEVLNRDAEHPIMQGWGAGWANPAGELYWIEKLGPTTHALAASKNREKGNEEVCVWTNEYGPNKTRVFGSTLGHHNVTVEHPKFLDLVTRGTLWACGKLNDDYLKPQVAQRIPVNLAKGATATASSEETGKNNFAKNAIDGNDGTRWCAANGSFPQTLTIDLGQPKTVTGVGLKWESSTTAYKFQLEGSKDGGKTWESLADQSKASTNITTETFAPQDIQQFKLTVLGSNTGGWASLWEVSLFGTETVEVSAEKTRAAEEQAFLSDVKVPEGFEASLFATPPAVQYPVFVAAAPEGTVYVSVDKNGSLDRETRRGSVVRLRDIDGDGRADESKLFVPDVDSPRGLVWDRDRLYLMHPPHLSAFIDHNGDGIADEQKVLVKNIAFGFADRPADHTSNGVTLGIDGWLYLAIGDFGFLEAEGTDGRKLQFRSGGVIRVRPDGTGLEVYSRGTRNILEVAMDPLLNGFTRDNTNDGGGWDIRLHHFTGLEHHGYPSLYKNFGEEMVQPLADYGGGSGCGALYVGEPGFPEGYGHALYTADWGRNWVYRHQMTANGATYQPDQHEFLGSTRVTDLDVDASSRLYVTSWKGATFTYAGEDAGYLVQLKPKGYTAPAVPHYAKLTASELVQELKSLSHRRRLAAQRELLGRQLVPSVVQPLSAMVQDSQEKLESRAAALYALSLGTADATAAVKQALKDAQLSPFACRIWGDDAAGQLELPSQDVVNLVASANPRTALEAMVALARRNVTVAAPMVAARMTDDDPVLAHTAVQAFTQLKNIPAALAIVDASNNPELREQALIAMRHWHDADVVTLLIERLAREHDAGRRQGLITALCRLHSQEGVWKGNSWGTRPDTSGPYYQPEPWSESSRIAELLRTTLDHAASDEAAFILTALNKHKISLDGTLERLLTMAAKDPKLVPAAVQELSRGSMIPEVAVPLLSSAVQNPELSTDIREQAAIALLKSDADAAFPAAVNALPDLLERGRKRVDPVWNAYLDSQRLGRRVEWLREQSAKSDQPIALFADAGLLAVASTKSNASPEAKALATKAIDEAWRQPVRRRDLLEALRVSNQREYADRIVAVVNDEDAQVAKLARNMAQQWKLELAPTPRGPQLKTLSPEEAISQVMKLPGKAGQGEAIFAKLNCSKCHTVKMGEPLRGPFLPNVAKTYKRPQLAEAVLLPSKSLAQGFVTYTFVMDDGKSYTGFVTNEAADEITIRDAEGKEIKLAPAAIEERVKQAISVMPEGLAKDLTIEEFASLLAYLESLAP
ncbi:c-type cytochrome [bacterium]|nr:c-type cytochrome [bacterium]